LHAMQALSQLSYTPSRIWQYCFAALICLHLQVARLLCCSNKASFKRDREYIPNFGLSASCATSR